MMDDITRRMLYLSEEKMFKQEMHSGVLNSTTSNLSVFVPGLLFRDC